MKRAKRLGRGLKSLISDESREPVTVAGDVRTSAETDSTLASGPDQTQATVPLSGTDSTTKAEVIGETHTGVDVVGASEESSRGAEAGGAQDDSANTMALDAASKFEGAGSMASTRIGIDALHANRQQPRKTFRQESVKTLARSIGQNGIIQPIVVRKDDVGFEIIAGERRWRASREAGLREVPVVVREATDGQMLELALVENIHREDLNAIDRAKAYQQLRESLGMSVEDVATRVGEDRTTVANYLRLLELPAAVSSMVACGRISMGHARSLLGVDDETRMIELASLVAGNGLSVRALEDVIRRAKPTRVSIPRVRTSSGRLPRSHVQKLERRFEIVLDTRVRIIGASDGKGRIVIEYADTPQFERIAEAMGVVAVVDGDDDGK